MSLDPQSSRPEEQLETAKLAGSDPDLSAASIVAPITRAVVPEQKPLEVPFSYQLHGEIISDHYQWLEDVRGAQPTVFVEQQNRRTLERFQGPVFDELVDTFTRLNTPDDLDMPGFGKTLVIKHKAEPDSPKGKILIASRDEFLANKQNTKFEVLLDIDKLAKDEGTDWVYAGAAHKPGIGDRMIVFLSKGGTDATMAREFDIAKKSFLDEGLRLEGEVRAAYLAKSDCIAFSQPSGPENTSSSGYPLEVKVWDRCGAIEDARTIYLAPKDHMSVGFSEWKIDKGDRRLAIFDYKNFYESEVYVADKERQQLHKLPLPPKCDILEVKNGLLLFSPRESYKLGEQECRGGIIALDLAGFLESGAESYTRVFQTQGSQSLEGAFVFKDRLYVHYSEDVVSKICESDFTMGELKSGQLAVPGFREIALPGHGTVNSFHAVKGLGIMVGYTDFVTPQSYYLISEGAKDLGAPFMQEPAKFDASKVKVSQQWAASADGTKVPYFVLDGRSDPSKPAQTILYGYGGFEISLKPGYSWVRGKGWLEKDGVYVVANIRGGGEFGPKWHEAALGANRIKAYEDFAAIADKLCESGYTAREKLGIMGGSNGGLLMGNMLTMWPEKFRAVVSNVPLLDMFRYDQLLKGSSWVAEYGSPQIKEQFEWLKRYSPYHNLEEGGSYPAVLFATSTADDRVHPCHARKMAAKMQGMGIPEVFLYEQTDGGHGNSDFMNWIPETALIYSFFHELLVLQIESRAYGVRAPPCLSI